MRTVKIIKAGIFLLSVFPIAAISRAAEQKVMLTAVPMARGQAVRL